MAALCRVVQTNRQMAIDPIGASSSSPVINFRPDPGEPAVRLAAPANQSALLVTAQEQRNETRLRSRAVVAGDQIIFSNRTFTPSVVGGDNAITAGLTTMVSRPGANQPETGLEQQPEGPPNPIDQAAEDLQKTEEEGQDSGQGQTSPLEEAQNTPLNPDEDEIDADQQDVERERDTVENDLQEAERQESEAAQDGSALEVRQAQAEQARLELEDRELKREENQLEVEKQRQRQENLNQDLTSAIEGNLAAAMGPLAALFGTSEPKQNNARGSLVDLLA